jgi:hypothetical protein
MALIGRAWCLVLGRKYRSEKANKKGESGGRGDMGRVVKELMAFGVM